MRIPDRMRSFFTAPRLPQTAFQISPGYISGIHLSPKNSGIQSRFIRRIEKGLVLSSYSEPNIRDRKHLSAHLKEGIKSLKSEDRKAALLLPEPSQRTFVFNFESLPSSAKEREQIIRFRIKKQMPMLAVDADLSYDVFDSSRVVAAIAKSAVVQDFENFFSENGWTVGFVGIPIIGLLGLIDWQKKGDFLLANLEEDSFSLLAVSDGRIVLCRQKTFGASGDMETWDRKTATVIQEIDNTVNFIEDHESKRLGEVWLRTGLPEEDAESIAERLLNSLPFSLIKIEERTDVGLGPNESRILAPLAGALR